MKADIEITYTDRTLAETDGFREEVAGLMASDRNSPAVAEWVIRSKLSISSQFGLAELDGELHSDGSFFILDYMPSSGDILYSPDIPAVSVWASQRGWMTPQPSESLCKDQRTFWKHFWETRLVDSSYLDSVHGERETNYEADWVEQKQDQLEDEQEGNAEARSDAR